LEVEVIGVTSSYVIIFLTSLMREADFPLQSDLH
jgi:hypothetical protein